MSRAFILVTHNARWDIPDNEGNTADQNAEVFDLLIKTYATKSKDGISYLFFANLLQFLTNSFGHIKWDHPFFHALISRSLLTYFKAIQSDFDHKLIDG